MAKTDAFLLEQLNLIRNKAKDPTIEWQDIADFRESATGIAEARDTIRKGNKLLQEYIDAGWSILPPNAQPALSAIESKPINSLEDELISGEVDELKDARIAYEKEKIKMRDERNEYNRLIRQEARKESYLEMVKNCLKEVDAMPRLNYQPNTDISFNSHNDLIIHLTDLHTGIETKNFWNEFNQDILAERIASFLDQIIVIQNRHNSENAYVIIGEILSGLIHENLRCENNMNLTRQFLTASTYICEFLDVLSKHFRYVNVYVTPGNHSRMSAKKEQSLKGENFDNLLIPYISARMQNYENISFYENHIEESIAMFNVRGNNVFSAHGDKDSPNNVVQKLSILFGIIPDLVYLGHRHRNGMSTVGNTKIVESGCVSGADSYAIDLRLNTKPEQTVSVIDESGLVCLYDVQL